LYPDYLSEIINNSNQFHAKSDKYDWFDVEIINSPLNGYKYINQSGSFVFQYDSNSKKWVSIPADIPEGLAPKKYQNNNFLIYYVMIADGGGQGETAYIESPSNDFIIKMQLSRNITAEHYSNKDEFFKILDDFNFY